MAMPFCAFKNLAGSKLGLIFSSQECANTFVNCCKSYQLNEDQGIIVAIAKGEAQIQHTIPYLKIKYI